jgi:hypothetical protein
MAYLASKVKAMAARGKEQIKIIARKQLKH